MSINQVLKSYLIVFMLAFSTQIYSGGLLDTVRDVTAGAINFAGEVVEKTVDTAKGIIEKTGAAAERVIYGPNGEVVEKTVVVEPVKTVEIEPEQQTEPTIEPTPAPEINEPKN